MSSQQNQCSAIGNEFYQREISKKIPSSEKQNIGFRPHIDPYRNDRNIPQYFQNIVSSVQHDSYQQLEQIKDKN